MQSYAVQAWSAADAATIYAMLLDAPNWSSWMAIDSIEVEKSATATTGELRRVTSGGHVSREQVVALEKDRSFSYVVESKMFTSYLGEVSLTPLVSGGTLIEWKANFRVRTPIIAWPFKLYLERFMRRTVNKLARAAEVIWSASSER